MRSFVVIGLGTFGMNVAKTLADEGANVTVIDTDRQLTEEIANSSDIQNALQIDSTSEKALRAAGIDMAECAIVCINKLETSILTTLALKKLNIPRVIARAASLEHKQILEYIGADEVVMPEAEMGQRIAKILISTHLVTHIELSQGHIVAEFNVPDKLVNKTIKELDFRKRFHVNIISIKNRIPDVDERGENIFIEKINDVPEPDYVLDENDILVVVGLSKNIENLRRYIEE